jgi:predicted helicase
MPTPFETYLAKIQADYKGGKATEHTYRSTLENLLEALERNVDASNDPKHIACGAPDFIVERRKVPVGYVETKDVGEDLDKIEKSDQLKRYRASLHNLILTDYLEFRWYVTGTPRLTARIASIGKAHKIVIDPNGIAQAEQLFAEFYKTEVPVVGTPKDLAQRMAALTKIVRDLIVGALREEGESGVFHKQLAAFKQQLIPNLSSDEFADIYAQTMAYGLFAARVNSPAGKTFNRTSAYQYLPPANPFLRRLFLDVGEELDDTPIAPFLDDLSELLNRADMESILKDFGKRTRTEDPVVHFYETFLAEYDPKLRKTRGVFYTPEPAVSFIVRSIDVLLRQVFKRSLGLADPNVDLLDPAVGTATFLYMVIRLIYETQQRRGQAGNWQGTAHAMLQRIFGFELLMAPYAIAHLKLGLLLTELGYEFSKHERLGVFLTNTLEQATTFSEQAPLGLAGYLSEEGIAANTIKNRKPIMVVLGNPPYSNFGMMNKGAWIRGLLEDYKKDLNEKKINLDDDFIKFIRFGQWRIDQTGQGILAFITNNTYIDGITHRRMRQSLMESFADIYILNLHGNSKKGETSPDGSKDENVFDIQQGVAISLFVKEPDKTGPAHIHHAELWGTRESKYEILSSTDVKTTKWQDIDPQPEQFFFVPHNRDDEAEFSNVWSVKDIFIDWQNCIKTDRDDLVFDFDPKALEQRMKTFYSESGMSSEFRKTYRIENSSSYDLLAKRQKTAFDKTNIRQCQYRPFDIRWLYYSPKLTSRPAWDVMKHMVAGPNIMLITCRQQSQQGEWRLVGVSNSIAEGTCISNKTKEALNYCFPLYLYTTPESTQGTLFAQTETTREPNLSKEFIAAVSEKLGVTFQTSEVSKTSEVSRARVFTPEDIFHYIYAVFHAPTYRTRYAEFLKIDFPRVPITSNRKLFFKLAALGEELVGLHLMKSAELDNIITTYPIKGSNEVVKVKYAPSPENRGRAGMGVVWINDKQYFGSVPESVWTFHIGGYQVCDKWLKDRKGRTLNSDDIAHYQKIVVALKETIRLMKEIDRAIPGWPIE